MIADLLLEPSARPVIGHRGASGLAPENTVASFDLALAQGAEALEFDVRLSKDGVPVVIHDATLDRTTDRSGSVAELSVAEIVAADAGARFAPQTGSLTFGGRGVRVPTLREVLERYPALPLLIEVKVAPAQSAVRDELARAGAAERAIVASFLHQALRVFRKPPFLCGASRRDIVRCAMAGWLHLPLPNRDGPRCFAVPDRYKDRVEVPTERFIRTAGDRGKPVHVWTVNDPARARALWRRGVSGIITNYPGRMVAERARLEV